ncbi:MAG: GMC family oxidoreductase [Candidatus Acidiferrales bacterium]|jgi:gluconate 2-dehydrogenase alpha chain
MKTLPSKDVVIIGAGWTGLLMAKELGARTPLSVVVLERGPARRPADYATDMDELDYFIRLKMMQDASRDTISVRHDENETALPIRQFGGFLPGSGTGGTGEHWGSVYPRLMPECFELYSKTVAKYGPKKLPEDHMMQDWGITYDDVESFYTRSEIEVGVSGKAGNIKGKKIEGGNIYEGWRSSEYPMPPKKVPYISALFEGAVKSLGYHPYPNPTAINSVDYTNPQGVSRPACALCGFCERFGCMISAKAQPTNVLLPLIRNQKSVTIRNGATVRRIVHDTAQAGGKARGVTYIDESGEEVFQPADLVFLASWTLNNTHLLLTSDLGNRYNPATGKGTLGRNLTHQVFFSVSAFLDKPLNRFMGAGGTGLRIGDFEGDALDQSNLPFLRGGTIQGNSVGTQPIASFGVLPRSIKATWGDEWKKAAIDYYDRTGIVSFSGEQIPHKGNYFDLDPTYKNHAGDPLLRMTMNWRENEREMAKFMNDKIVEIVRAMGAKEVNPFSGYGNYDLVRYQSTHVQGGTIMAPSPDLGVLNTYQQHWQASNLFVLGASTFPNSGAANPTPTILALTYRTADAIVDRYLKKPGMLA